MVCTLGHSGSFKPHKLYPYLLMECYAEKIECDVNQGLLFPKLNQRYKKFTEEETRD